MILMSKTVQNGVHKRSKTTPVSMSDAIKNHGSLFTKKVLPAAARSKILKPVLAMNGKRLLCVYM